MPDHQTGRAQHSYEVSRGPGYGHPEEPKWMAQGQAGSKGRDSKPELRWSQVARVANATGQRGFPQLHPEVTVPVSRLPFDQVERHSVQMLYLSWIECGMRCPVVGCEPWAALDASDKYALSQPQAMVTRDKANLVRTSADCAKMDPLMACCLRSRSAREHMWSGFESVIEHWAHFHMKAGRCFSAPCCSRTPIEKLPETCHRRMFQSLSSAVQHLIEAHREEVRDQQQKWVSDKKKAVANKSPKTHQEAAELLIDLKSGEVVTSSGRSRCVHPCAGWP